MLSGVQVVILDEIHSIVAGKRGTHLITAVERLVRLAGEFQRIALSATVRPLELVAEFVGGFARLADGGYRPRPVAVVQATAVEDLPGTGAVPRGRPEALPVWDAIAEECRATIARNRSTLVFTNCPPTGRDADVADQRGRGRRHGGAAAGLRPPRRAGAGDPRRGGEPAEVRPRCAAIVATSSLETGHRHRRARRGDPGPVAAGDRLRHPARRARRAPGGRGQPRHSPADPLARTCSPRPCWRAPSCSRTSKRSTPSAARWTCWPRC